MGNRVKRVGFAWKRGKVVGRQRRVQPRAGQAMPVSASLHTPLKLFAWLFRWCWYNQSLFKPSSFGTGGRGRANPLG